MIKLCLMFLSLFSLLLSFSLFSFQDPKGDESRMLSLRLSGCPEERVWQESSEWLYLLLPSLPQSSTQSCSSGSKVTGVVSFAIRVLFVLLWENVTNCTAEYAAIHGQCAMKLWNSQVKYVIWSWGSVVKTGASVFMAFLYFVFLSSPSDLHWICSAASVICWSLLVSAWLSLKFFFSFIYLWPLLCCQPKDTISWRLCHNLSTQTRGQNDSLSLPCFHFRPSRKTLFRNKTKQEFCLKGFCFWAGY